MLMFYGFLCDALQGNKSGVSRLLADPGSQVGSPQSASVPCSSQANSPAPTVQTSFASNPIKVDWNGQTLSTEFEDVDSRSDAGASSLSQPMLEPVLNNACLHSPEVGGKMCSICYFIYVECIEQLIVYFKFS